MIEQEPHPRTVYFPGLLNLMILARRKLVLPVIDSWTIGFTEGDRVGKNGKAVVAIDGLKQNLRVEQDQSTFRSVMNVDLTRDKAGKLAELSAIESQIFVGGGVHEKSYDMFAPHTSNHLGIFDIAVAVRATTKMTPQ